MRVLALLTLLLAPSLTGCLFDDNGRHDPSSGGGSGSDGTDANPDMPDCSALCGWVDLVGTQGRQVWVTCNNVVGCTHCLKDDHLRKCIRTSQCAEMCITQCPETNLPETCY